MEHSEGDETYMDLPSDEVRPSGGTADMFGSVEDLETEPDSHPDYRLGFDSAENRVQEDDQNPNLVRLDHDDSEAVQQHRDELQQGGPMRPHGDVFPREPPYGGRVAENLPGEMVGSSIRQEAGRGSGDIARSAQLTGDLSTSGYDFRRATREERVPHGAAGLLLNGGSNLDGGGRGHQHQGGTGQDGAARVRSSVENPDGESSLEQLVQQLLKQNSILQQELLEAKHGSGSGSNVSAEGRAEGRGSWRLGLRGKGIGGEGGAEGQASGHSSSRLFYPPWTSCHG